MLICVTKLCIYSFSTKKKKKSYIFIVLKVVVIFFFYSKVTVMVFLKATIIIISSNWCSRYEQQVGSLKKNKKFSPFKGLV